MNKYYIYILTNKSDNLYYTGVTNNIIRRIYEHKNKLIEGYTSRYNLNIFVYYEEYNDVNQAIAREKEVKDWRREKKRELILSLNPEYKDLYDDFVKGFG
jgi:putative endonuclease